MTIENQPSAILQEFDQLTADVTAKLPQLQEAMLKFRDMLKAAEGLSVENAGEGFFNWIRAVIVLATLPPYNEKSIEILETLAADAEELTKLMPAIEREVKQYKFAHKMATMPFDYFVTRFDEDGGTPRNESIFEGIRDKAASMLRALRGNVVTPKKVTLNLSKVNERVFNFDYDAHRQETEIENVFELQTRTAWKDYPTKTEPIFTLFTVDFRELGENVQISKTLTVFDERVYAAVDALYRANRREGTEYVIVSATQIFRVMGGTAKPTAKQKARILGSLNRLMFTRLTIDNTAEAESSKKYELYPYKGNLLQADFLPYPCIINGKTVDQPIRLLATPPLMSYARARRQVAYIPAAAYQLNIRSDQQGLALTDYLLKFISKQKNQKHYKFNILVATMFEALGIYGKMQKQRALYGTKAERARIPTILDHFKDVGIIQNYRIYKDEFNEIKIEITLTDKG